jgi:hypothetical protein
MTGKPEAIHMDEKRAYRTSMISKVKGKAMNSWPRWEGAGLDVRLTVFFKALLYWVPAWNAEPDIHLLSRAVAVTDV